MLKKLLTTSLMLFAMSAAVFGAGDDAPAWLQQLAATKVPTYDKKVPVVVLLDEVAVTVDSDGKVVSSYTYAVRILTREGRGYAEASQMYLTNSSKVREIKAWLIRPSGEVRKFEKNDVIDVISDPNDIYDEYRVKTIDASREAEVGSVFGYQTLVEEKPLFNHDRWYFQGWAPVLVSRYRLNLPNGWRASSVTFNHAPVEPSVQGNSYTWELQGLPPIEIEAASPKITNLASRLAIDYFPPQGTSSITAKSFSNWKEVSRWLTELHDPQVTIDDSIAGKARELTANSKTELERIQAIGRFVQNLQYISIQTDVGRGNGYRPRPASLVLARAYGDCKDKANLMRSMLKTLKIEAYPVSIFAGDPTYVREEWASPGQFNHCIIAVKVSDETVASTVVTHPVLGRLLIFDATDPYTPVGGLPSHEQGSLALIIAGDSGALLRMPITPPEYNRLEREVEILLNPDGSVLVKLVQNTRGQSAVNERGLFRELPKSDYAQVIEGWISRGVTGARITKVEPTDRSAEGRFSLDVEFSARSYGQVMRGNLMVFKPAVVSRHNALFLTESTRKHAIVIGSSAFTETVRVTLPEGFAVDELPDSVKLDVGFGTYLTTYEVRDGKLVFTRSLTQQRSVVPVEDYQKVRSFYEKIRAAEQNPVVLARK